MKALSHGYTSANRSTVVHFGLWLLGLIGALLLASAALAQNYNAMVGGGPTSPFTDSRTGEPANHWVFDPGTGEAIEEPLIQAALTPPCQATSFFVEHDVTQYFWSPREPGDPGYYNEISMGTCAPAIELGSVEVNYCGPGTRWVAWGIDQDPGGNGGTGDCESGFYAYLPTNTQQLGKPSNPSTGTVATPDPIEIGNGNMYRHEIDFAAADPRLQYARSYNSSSVSVNGPVGNGWTGAFDAHIVDITEVISGAGPGKNVSPIYSDPATACQQGFYALEASSNDPPIWVGLSPLYTPPQVGYGAGTCQAVNGYGVAQFYILIMNTNSSYARPSAPLIVNVGYGVVRDDGSQYAFYCNNGTCYPAAPNVSLMLSIDASGNYTLIDEDGVTEHYDSYGMLQTRTWKDGYQLSFVQNGNGITSGDGTLQSIADNHGRRIGLAYNSYGRLTSLSTPDGQSIRYSIDGLGRLSTVTNPTGTRTYQYGNASFPNALTGILDEDSNGNPSPVAYVTWTYDSNGLANGNAQAGGVNSVAIVHNNDGSASVTDALGTQRTYTFQNNSGTRAVVGISGPFCDSCGAGASTTYDGNGYLASSTDWNSHVTAYTFDPSGNGLLKQRIDAQNTSVQRTNTLTWDPILRNVQQSTVNDVSGKLVSQVNWTYNARGQALTQTQTDPVTHATRTTTMTYCEEADLNAGTCPLLGLLKTVADPLGHLTTYSYYPGDASSCASAPSTCPYRAGDLQKITNALGQVATILSYDGAGRVLSMTDINNVESDLQYSPRGWLTQIAVRATNGMVTTGSDQVTGLTYDNDGVVTQITQPNGAYSSFTYDPAGRLTDIADNLGDDIHYTLDAAGDRTEDDTKDPSGNLKRIVRRQFNALGQLAVNANAALNGSALVPNMSYAYDSNGNANALTDGRGTITSNSFDALNRISQITQDPGTGTHANAITAITADALDRTRIVTDPQGLPTSYTFDGLDDLTLLSSPDTGSTTNTFDVAGNLKTSTDARSIKSTYGRDVLNRVTSITYTPTTTPSDYTTLTWDTTQSFCNQTTQIYSAGRVTKFTDASGTSRFCYDRFGRMVKKQQVISAATLTTSYVYDLGNHLTQVTTPGGTLITYTRDALGRITKVAYRLSGQTSSTTLVKAVTYYPYGPVASITYNDNRVLSRSYDQDYVVSAISDTATGGLNLGFGRDVLGNITQLTSGSAGINLVYDPLNRLKIVNDLSSTQIAAYSYDATGNRLTSQGNASSQISYYTYPTASHQLQAVGPTGNAVPRGYDAMGNTTLIGSTGTTTGFVYDNTARMTQVNNSAGAAQMQYLTNAQGQRVQKYLAGNSALTQFTTYDESGHTLGEYDGSLNRIREMVWMDGMPVGVISSTTGTVTYLEPDQLGTPRTGIDAAGNSQTWNWSPINDPFGKSQPTGSLSLDLRMPGQMFDAESGLNYNYFRDYDSGTGRAIESDPLGLGGGISTYGYVGGNPLSFSDPFGLAYYDKTWGWDDYLFAPTFWARQEVGLDTSMSQTGTNLATGAADDLSFGIGRLLRSEYGIDGGIDPCSTAYKVGQYAALAAGLGRLGYAGAAKLASNAAVDGMAANAARNGLKVLFRGGLFSNSGMPAYDALLAKYGSDEAVQAAAGRTSPLFNAMGADAAGGGGANTAAGCGCNK